MESKEEAKEERRRVKKEIKRFNRTQADVCAKLAEHMMSKEAQGKNMVFSPLSIQVVLGLVSAALKGEARDELLAYLNSDSSEEFCSSMSQLVDKVFADGTPLGGPCLSFLNGMWIHNSFRLKENFKGILDQSYKTPITHVDFQNQADDVRKEVNDWAEQKTNGLITEVLPPESVNSLTRFIFANVLYFKGAWDEIFDAAEMRKGKFFLLDGTRIKVTFITSWKKQYISSYDSFKVLKLFYQNDNDKRNFSMYFYLPNAKDGLPALVEKFGSEPGFIKKHIPEYGVAVGDFRFPRFKISYDFEACDVLKKMGLVTPLTSDLTELAYPTDDTRPLNDSKIFHKSFIEVDETGATAAVISAWTGGIGCCMNSPPKVDFVANHPFLFVIREDKTGTVLFVGQVLNPLA